MVCKKFLSFFPQNNFQHSFCFYCSVANFFPLPVVLRALDCLSCPQLTSGSGACRHVTGVRPTSGRRLLISLRAAPPVRRTSRNTRWAPGRRTNVRRSGALQTDPSWIPRATEIPLKNISCHPGGLDSVRYGHSRLSSLTLRQPSRATSPGPTNQSGRAAVLTVRLLPPMLRLRGVQRTRPTIRRNRWVRDTCTATSPTSSQKDRWTWAPPTRAIFESSPFLVMS